MSTHAPAALRRIALAALLSFSLLAAGCSDDADTAGPDEPTASAVGDESEWCAAVRRSQNVVTSKFLDNIIEQAEVAPEELAADYDAAIEMLEYQAANPADAVGIAERTQAAGASVGRIVLAVNEECGIAVSLG